MEANDIIDDGKADLSASAVGGKFVSLAARPPILFFDFLAAPKRRSCTCNVSLPELGLFEQASNPSKYPLKDSNPTQCLQPG